MQLPITSKKERSHIVIDNSGSPQETRAQVERVWKEITRKSGEG
jgi:dephospho-CoA kinase